MEVIKHVLIRVVDEHAVNAIQMIAIQLRHHHLLLQIQIQLMENVRQPMDTVNPESLRSCHMKENHVEQKNDPVYDIIDEVLTLVR